MKNCSNMSKPLTQDIRIQETYDMDNQLNFMRTDDLRRVLIHSLKAVALFLVLFITTVPDLLSQPVIKVRFNNPTYNCASQTYCVDVEFQSNTADQQLFGMNVRFYYDDSKL